MLVGLIAGSVIASSMQQSIPEDNFEDFKQDKSHVFSGIENTTVQGDPVPLIYGEVYTGSVVVSEGVSVEEVGK